MKFIPLNENLGYLLNVTTNAINTLMQRKLTQAGIEVPLEQLKLLMFISKNAGVNQQMICAAVNKAKPGISRLVDGLVKKGLIERKEDPNDRRNKLHFITPAGLEVRDSFYPLAIKNLAMLEAELGPETSAELKHHLIAIKEIILNKLND